MYRKIIPVATETVFLPALNILHLCDCSSILAAVCEKKSILIFDPLSRALIDVKEKAHNDCVNCVRYIYFCKYDYHTIASKKIHNL